MTNLYLEYFEKKALHTDSTPRHWFRFVDDTFVIQQEAHKQLFLDHINNIDAAITFTVEGYQEEWCYSIPSCFGKARARQFLINLCIQRNPPILTMGIVITIWPPSIVSSVPLSTRLKQFVLGQSSLIRNYSTLQRLCLSANLEEGNTQEGTTEEGADSTCTNPA